jgi:hypothetical protein
MRRLLLLLALVAAAAPGCAPTERPEGVVERWLLSLNQGAAGHPDRYAPARLSDAVLPGWRDRDPGALDVIEVGVTRPGREGTLLVPFQVTRVDEQVARAFAVVASRDGELRIVGLEPPPDSGPAREPGFVQRSGVGARPIAWLAAFAVAVALIALAAGLMRLVPEPSSELRTRPGG